MAQDALPHDALTDIKACVFDAYGTLFDVASAAKHCVDDLGDNMQPLANLWRDKQLQYTWLRSLMDEYVPFRQITEDGLDYALTALGLDGDAVLKAKLLDLYWELDAYPEVPAMLDALKAGGIKTAILSNGSPDMLTSAVTNSGVAERMDEVLSVEPLRIFKPHGSVYQMGVDTLGVRKENICFMSSNSWDATGAANFGFRVVWVNRFDQPVERLVGADRIITQLQDLSPLPGLLGLD